MRPLQRKPEVAEQARDSSCLPALLTEMGPYCRICEIPLTDHAAVIDFQELELVEPSRPIRNPERWWALYPVCNVCGRAFDREIRRHLRTLARPSPAADLMTLEKLNWSVEFPPIHYAVEKLTKIVEQDGQVVDQTEVEMVLVRPSLNNKIEPHFIEFLIDWFALNSLGINYPDRTLTVNEHSELVLDDRRVEHRTKVWHQALGFCERLRNVAGERDPMDIGMNNRAHEGHWWRRQARLLAGHTGFWSVWVTVLWNEFQNKDFVVRCLWNEDAADKPQLGHFSPQNPFPATMPYSK